jgi:hypothetical protein
MEMNLSQELTYKQILLHSPYERLLRFGIERKDFENYMLVVSPEYINIAKNLLLHIEISNHEKSLLFLTGFPGVGKTTFINWIIQEAKKARQGESLSGLQNLNRIVTEYINFSFSTTSREDYFKVLIGNVIRNNIQDYISSFEFIINHWDIIRNEFGLLYKEKEIVNYFLTYKGYENIQSMPDTYKESLEEKWKEFEVHRSESSLILLCLIEKFCKIRGTNDYCYFFIDNLDALSIGYLLDGFWKDYLTAFHAFCGIMERTKNYKYVHRVKIIFTLRQYNYNLAKLNMNRHAHDVVKPYIGRPDYFFQKDIEKIIQRRKEYASNIQKLLLEDDLTSYSEAILNDKGHYLNNVYSPLFNYDIRRFLQKIIEIVTQTESVDFVFNKPVYYFLHENEPHRNGARGVILHSLIKAMFISDEKYPIDPVFADETLVGGEPYCSYCRLLMTLIFNLSYPNGHRLLSDLSNLETLTPIEFTLDRLISNLRIYGDRKSIIPYKSVFDWITKFASIKINSSVHLIDIFNKQATVEHDYDFSAELEAALALDDSEIGNSILNKVKMRINPSGVIYLRYIIRHFEFLAAYKYWNGERFTIKFKPLFLSTNYDPQKKRYEFELLLEDVYHLVKKKKLANDMFLKEFVFCQGSRIPNIASYLQSKFILCLDDSDNDRYLESRQLYSSAVITTHIRYIIIFLDFLTTSNDIQVNILSVKERYPEAKGFKEIKEFIYKVLADYINLYYDANQDVMDPNIRGVMKSLKKEISSLG